MGKGVAHNLSSSVANFVIIFSDQPTLANSFLKKRLATNLVTFPCVIGQLGDLFLLVSMSSGCCCVPLPRPSCSQSRRCLPLRVQSMDVL